MAGRSERFMMMNPSVRLVVEVRLAGRRRQAADSAACIIARV